MVGRGDHGQRMAVEPGQHLVDLADLPRGTRPGAVEQKRIRFVEQKDALLAPRLLEGGGDVLFGAADPFGQQVRRPPHQQRPVEHARQVVGQGRLAGAGRAGQQQRYVERPPFF